MVDGTWTAVDCPVAPAARSAHVCVVEPESHRLFLFGGLGNRRANDVWEFEIATGKWREIVPKNEPPCKRSKTSMVAHQGRLYIFGGWIGGRTADGKLNDLWAFDIASSTWTEVKTAGSPPERRSSHSAAVSQGVMYVYGGIGAHKYGDLHMFSFATRNWSAIRTANTPPPRSSYGDLMVLPTGLLTFGGLTCGQLNDLQHINLTTKTWEALPYHGQPPCKRGRHASLLVGDTVFVFGGTDLKRKFNDFFSYHIPTSTWRRLKSQGPTPPPSEGHSMVLLPDGSFLLFGGWLQDSFSNRTYIWRRTPTPAGPLPEAAEPIQDESIERQFSQEYDVEDPELDETVQPCTE
eukprot:TRINITY_DN64350_c0_g1_i1.p1 TRINITY_DN64350_c0_g1~~TRINITY_DN64350_c0_g1_i1.p1  ORF type:complete len:358 (+),score=34.21 TRINITY_DN64350_c0_g1_i1:28-1074(+)